MIVHSKMISKHHQFIGSLNEKYYHIRIKSNKITAKTRSLNICRQSGGV